MFRSVKLALLTLACSLMLLHNLTPHIHHSGLITDEFEIKRIAPNKAGLLQEIFQLDLGCNHLEEASQSKFDFTTTITAGTDLPIFMQTQMQVQIVEQNQQPKIIHAVPIVFQIQRSASGLRAPPLYT